MKLTWQILRKDLVRFRYPLLLAAAMQAVLVWEAYRQLYYSGPASEMLQQQLIYLIVWFLTQLVSFAMVGVMVLEDSPTDVEAFWPTRPISGTRLLTAKLVGVTLMFVLLPVLLWLPWWLACGFDAVSLLHAGVSVAGQQALLVMVSFMLATLNGRGGRYLVSCLVLVLLLLEVTVVVPFDRGIEFEKSLVHTRLWLAGSILLLAGAGMVVLRYRTRRIGQANLLLGMGIALGALVLYFWQWDSLALLRRTPAMVGGLEALQVEAHDATVTDRFANSDGSTTLMVRLSLIGLPKENRPVSGRADMELYWPDGSTNSWRDRRIAAVPAVYADKGLLPSPNLEPDPETDAKRKELKDKALQRPVTQNDSIKEKKLAALMNRTGEMDVILPISRKLVQRIEVEHPRCVVRAWVDLGEPEKVLEAPVRVSTTYLGKNFRVYLADLSPSPQSPSPDLTVRESGRESVTWHAQIQSAASPVLRNLRFYVVSRSFESSYPIPFWGSSQSLPPWGNTGVNIIPLRSAQLWRKNHWVMASNWLDSLILVGLHDRELGAIERTVEIEHLKLKPAE